MYSFGRFNEILNMKLSLMLKCVSGQKSEVVLRLSLVWIDKMVFEDEKNVWYIKMHGFNN
jgi:hypothetical protein